MKSKITTLVLTATLFCCNPLFSANTTWTWTGTTNTDWSTKSNWSTTDANASINGNDSVIINSGAPNYPTLTADVNLHTFTMNGGSFDTDGYDFNSNGNSDIVINGGNFNAGTTELYATNLYIYGGILTIDGSKLDISDDVVIDGGELNIILNNAVIPDDLFLTKGTLDLNNWNLTVMDEFTYDANKLFIVKDAGKIFIENLLLDFPGADTLDYNIYVLNSAEFIEGILITSSSATLIFSHNATVSGASNTAHVNGPVTRLVNTSGNTAFNFPVGDGTVYAPISIANFSQGRTQDYFVAQYFNTKAPYNTDTMESTLNHISTEEYWTLERFTTGGTATTDAHVRLSFDEDTRSGQIDDASDLMVARWNGTLWVDHGGSNRTGNNTSAGTVETSLKPTVFGTFTLASSSAMNPLPVTFLDFKAQPVAKTVKVSWTVISEINNDFFTVQTCTDGKSWSVIGIIDGKDNSGQIATYDFIDRTPVIGTQYYRLIQTDVDGQSTFSNVVMIKFEPATTVAVMDVYPNPAQGVVSFSLNEAASDATIILYNSMGVLVMELSNQSGNSFSLDMTDLERGIYTIEIRQESGVIISKLLKN